MSIKILIADDHKIVRDGICSLLEKHPNMEVVAAVDNGREAVEVAKKYAPDVVIMDICMPGLNGIEATRQITENNPNIKVIGLSMYSDVEYVSGLLKAGGTGYILKECAFAEVILGINAVVRNKSYICPDVVDVVIKGFKGNGVKHDQDDTPPLTSREREILQLIAEGNSSKEIAAKLNLSVKTVACHRQSIMDKLKCHDVVKLTKYAIRKGVTSADN